jgi:hypothetical protein
MPNLAETVSTNQLAESNSKALRVCLTKHDLSVSASAERVSKSERFYLVKMPIRKLPLISIESSAAVGAIVIDTNGSRRKATGSGFVPKVIVLKGLRSLQAAKAAEKMFCNVWVGEKALRRLHISAEDAIGSNVLQTKLQRLISDKNKKSMKASGGSYTPSPWVEAIYPSDNYFVYRYDGDTYRQAYNLDKKTGDPTLSGGPVKAIVKNLPQVSAASLADLLYGDTYIDKTMNQELTLDRVNMSGPTLGRVNYPSHMVPCGADGIYYPAGSELSRPELRTMLNVREALSIFLNVLKDGMKGPLEHSFSPVAIPTDKFLMNACREAEIVAREAHRKIDPVDFVNWQHDTLTKKGTQTKYGITASGYAYVGDPGDISTWHLKALTPDHVKKSLKLVMSCTGIPESKKLAIQAKLKAMLKKTS